MKIFPSIILIDEVEERISTFFKKVKYDDGNYYYHSEKKYYSNTFKRIIAAWYVLSGKGMVIQFARDYYKNYNKVE